MEKIDLFSGATDIYNLKCCHPKRLSDTGANVMGCRLAPLEQSETHNHFENEIFVFISGHGHIKENNLSIPIKAGDAVLFNRFENHTIINDSSSEELVFQSLYWSGQEDADACDQPVTNSAIVFSTPPTPNGDLHLGHLSGPYLAADVLTRSLRTQGRNAIHITGRDDNQTYVSTCGRKEGRSPAHTANHYDKMLRETWSQFGIDPDGYIDPSATSFYGDFVRYGIDQLIELGWIESRTEPAAFDNDGNYLHEAYIKGNCPHPKASSDGNACEACGRPNACVDLIDPRESISGTGVTFEPVKRLYFRLSSFEKELSQYVRSASMPAHVAALC